MDFKFYVFISLSIFSTLLLEASGQEKCKVQGTICSNNCKQVLTCVAPGLDPIPKTTCPSNQVCRDADPSGGKARCEDGTGCASDIKVRCGTTVELPHPTQTGSSIICLDISADEEPRQICNCPEGSYVDITQPSFPCKAGRSPRAPVICDRKSKNGKIPGTNQYCYYCKEVNEILVYVCNVTPASQSVAFAQTSYVKQCKPSS